MIKNILRLGAAAGMVAFGSTYAAGISGEYIVSGTNPNGSSYSGTAVIVDTSKSTCRITWVTGQMTGNGICMQVGQVFTASYSMGGLVGLIVYRTRADGSLEGKWTVADESGFGTERLLPKR